MGRNTAISTSEMPITAADTSSIVTIAASRGDFPASMFRSTFSTTTMASSTTIPMARINPKSVSRFSEKPSASITAKVPTSDTGIATSGMTAARQDCRNTITTTTTRSTASKIVL